MWAKLYCPVNGYRIGRDVCGTVGNRCVNCPIDWDRVTIGTANRKYPYVLLKED